MEFIGNHVDNSDVAVVRKSNRLIQASRFSLTVNQQRIILYLISKINPWDDDFKEYDFDIREFCKVCDIHLAGKSDYTALKDAIKDIHNQSFWIEQEDGTQMLLSWIRTAKIIPRSGTIKIGLDPNMKPYLIHLQSNYTQYELQIVLRFRSKYSIRLYELIQSIHFDKFETYERTFTLEELQVRMDADVYKTWEHFKSRALIPAIDEINEYSGKLVLYTPIKQGKKIQSILLTIKTKETVDRLLATTKPKKQNSRKTKAEE